MWRFSNFHPLFSTVGPDDICDLGYLKRGDKFRLTPFVVPNNFSGVLEANQKMVVGAKAIADNAESKPICIEISWDGTWSEGASEMASHLVVKEVNCFLES